MMNQTLLSGTAPPSDTPTSYARSGDSDTKAVLNLIMRDPVDAAQRHEVSSPRAVDSTERQQLICETAYRLFLERGGVDGHDQDDWLVAEAVVDSMLAQNGAEKR